MYSVTDRYKKSIKHGQTAILGCDVYSGFSKLKSLSINDGNVRYTEDPISGRCDVTLTDPTGELVPATASEILSPFGNELHIRRGLLYPDGTKEEIPLGIFGISDVKIDASGESLQMVVDGYTRERRFKRARLVAERQFSSGSSYKDSIKTLLQESGLLIPFCGSFGTGVVDRSTPNLIFSAGDDRWDKASEMAEALGARLLITRLGEVDLVTITDPATTPVVESYVEGPEATFLYTNKRMNDEQTYNHVVVTGETTEGTAAVRAEAIDGLGTSTSSVYYLNDANSPTRIDGPYGDVVYFFTSEFISTQTQAFDVAKSLLFKVLGAYEEIRFNLVPNPAHDVGDVIQITHNRPKINARYVIDAITIPLTIGRAMDINTRKRRV